MPAPPRRRPVILNHLDVPLGDTIRSDAASLALAALGVDYYPAVLPAPFLKLRGESIA